MTDFDIVIIGAGIAGASVAFELAPERKVLVLERESQPGYHATGRSVATFSETYGNTVIRGLTAASRAFFEAPPAGFASQPLLTPRGVLTIGRADQQPSLERAFASVSASDASVGMVGEAEARRRVPLLRPDYVAGALWKPRVMDIDVSALHQGYLGAARRRGAVIETEAEVVGLTRRGGRWEVETRRGVRHAAVVVDAAGAWADAIAASAGLRPIGLAPRRRTALTFAAPAEFDMRGWPMVVDVDEQFYVKPEAGRLLASPCDETPTPPCDARPDELDIAQCVARVERAAAVTVRRVERSWAGLRSFVADRTPVVGFDPGAAGFFWLAGQGGYGIQTAPAMGRTAASLILNGRMPVDVEARGVTAALLGPQRLRAGPSDPMSSSS